MSVFPTAKTSYHGPDVVLVTTKAITKSNPPEFPRISRAGSYFVRILVQVASALIKSKKHPEFTTRYRRIKARRGHKKAITAICRMSLTAIWHILSDLKLYTPEGFLESHPVNESKVLTTSQALNLLKQRGCVIQNDAVSAI